MRTYALHRIACMCVGGGGQKRGQSRTGMCVWPSCRLLHQTGIGVAMHIPPVVLLAFLHTPALNIFLWKNPLRRYRPLPLHTLKISSRDHLYTPRARWLVCPPLSFTYCTDAMQHLFFSPSPFAPSHSFRCLLFPAWHFCRHRKPRQPVAPPANPADHPDGQVAR